MGLFNWMMRGLGFETEKKAKEDKKETLTPNVSEKYENFNLHERVETNGEKLENNVNAGFSGLNMQPESNIILYTPKTKKEIQEIVDYLKQGQTIAVDLKDIAPEDVDRILDFLSGAIYALNGSIHQWQGDLFLLTSEGHRIYKQQK